MPEQWSRRLLEKRKMTALYETNEKITGITTRKEEKVGMSGNRNALRNERDWNPESHVHEIRI